MLREDTLQKKHPRAIPNQMSHYTSLHRWGDGRDEFLDFINLTLWAWEIFFYLVPVFQ